jgi:nitrate reductase cytochrome c-type subunit
MNHGVNEDLTILCIFQTTMINNSKNINKMKSYRKNTMTLAYGNQDPVLGHA